MAGNSTTTLNPGTTGDLLYNEDIGSSIHLPAAKIHTGALGVDGGPVTTANPFPTRSYDGTNPTFPTGAAAADAESNSTIITRIGSYLFGANGTPTWDRIRSGTTALGSTFTGFLNTLPTAIYHTSRTTRTNGQGGPLEANAQGDLTFHGATPLIFTFATLPTAGTQVFLGACVGYTFFFINTTLLSLSMQVYDATATQSGGAVPLQGTASVATSATLSTTMGSAFYGLKFSNGIWLQASTTVPTMTGVISTAFAGYVLYLPL